MIRSQSGQSIGAQMINALTGAAFTDAVTIYITGDAGAQAIGSVGAGICTHEGNGYHTYRPSESETDYALIAFTFVGSGAIPQTIQVEPITTSQAAAVGGPTALSENVGQDILDMMEILHPELQLQTGEPDVNKALVAVNMARGYFESILAQAGGVLGDNANTVTTTANTETTTFPIGLLRLDKIQYISDDTDLPAWDLEAIDDAGGHAPARDWLDAATTNTTGIPKGYWTNGRLIYWDPIPDAAYTMRWYGFQSASPITATGTVTYPEVCLLPIATMAVKLWRSGLDDDPSVMTELAHDVFDPVVQTLTTFRREGASSLVYRYTHGT